MPRRYLVTGGAGLHRLASGRGAARGAATHVRVVDNLSTGQRGQPRGRHGGGADGGATGTPEFIEGDLADRRGRARPSPASTTCCTRRRFRRCRGRWPTRSTSNRANIDATLNVLVAARDAGVRRVVFAGSSSVYGDARRTAEARGHADRGRCRPTRCRSWSASSTCQLFTALYGLETVTTRYFNVFGPRQDPSSPYSGVISLFIRARARRPAADDLRRRRADARLHLRRQRRRRRAARGGGAGRRPAR